MNSYMKEHIKADKIYIKNHRTNCFVLWFRYLILFLEKKKGDYPSYKGEK
jgi:hypothetical protein